MKKCNKILMLAVALLFGLGLSNVVSTDAAAATMQAVTPTELVTGDESVVAAQTTVAVPKTGNTVVPLPVSKAGVLTVSVPVYSASGTVKVSLYSDAALTQSPVSSNYFSFSTGGKSEDFAITAAGTYYLCVEYSYTTSKTQAGTIDIAPYFISTEERTLVAGQYSAIPTGNSTSADIYAKMEIPSAGYIAVTQRCTSSYNTSYALCDANKSPIINSKGIGNQESYYYPVSAGTYYLKTKGNTSACSSVKYDFVSELVLPDSGVYELPVMSATDTEAFYLKYTAPATGLVTFGDITGASYYATLLNAGMQAVSDRSFVWHGTFSVAVKKGTTYYLKVEPTIGNDTRQISVAITNYKSSNNKTMKKAVALKKNKANTSVIVAGDTKYHWYKIKLTKKKALNVTISATGNGTFACVLVNSKGKQVTSFSGYNGKYKTTSKIKKGTYYLKVKNNTATSSGKYTIKYK